MENLAKAYQWVMANYENLFLALSALVAFAELAVRFTPTEKDDGFVERIGGYLRKVMDFVKLPNKKKNELEPPKK